MRAKSPRVRVGKGRALRSFVVGLSVCALILAACGTDAPDDESTAAGTEEDADESTAAGTEEDADESTAAGTEEDAGDAPYYQGKTIEMIVPFAPGGGGDTLARAVANFLTVHVEGNPGVQVVNRAGGGSVLGANEFANHDRRDGTVMLFTSASTLLPWLLGEEAVEYDLKEMSPVLGMPRTRLIYASGESGIETPADLLDPPGPLQIGGQTGLGTDLFTLLALEILDVRDSVDMILGYEGAAAQQLAFFQGEINLDHTASDSYMGRHDSVVEDMQGGPFLSFGWPDGEGGMIPDPIWDIPDIMQAHEEMYGEPPSGDLWDAYYAIQDVVTSYFSGFSTHGDAPPEAVAALREGAERMLEDEAFISIVGEDGDFFWPPLVGDELLEFQDRLDALDQRLLDDARQFLRDEYGI